MEQQNQQNNYQKEYGSGYGDASYLNVIACSGQWLKNQKTFTNRLVVFTDLVK